MCEFSTGRTRSWKVFGPDLNGRFGGLQGTGGLEAVILDADGTTTGVINDQFGNGVASVSGGSVTWNTTRVGAYGPLPGIQAQTLTDVTQLAAATAWRSRRIDPTGFYWLGARYYEPTSGRFLSADPMGQSASPSLYDYAGGDPVNGFDPDGRVNLELLNPSNEDDAKLIAGDRLYNPSGVYSISGHGNPTTVREWVPVTGRNGFGIQMSPSRLVGRMDADGYTPGMPVILLSCNTGTIGPGIPGYSGNIASQLSQQLSQQYNTSTVVVAPQTYGWTNQVTGAQETGIRASWSPEYNDVGHQPEYWNVFYDGTLEIPLTNAEINSPDLARHIGASITAGETLRMLQKIDDAMLGNDSSNSSHCPMSGN
jgi:RHS repeat-associated protein